MEFWQEKTYYVEEDGLILTPANDQSQFAELWLAPLVCFNKA